MGVENILSIPKNSVPRKLFALSCAPVVRRHYEYCIYTVDLESRDVVRRRTTQTAALVPRNYADGFLVTSGFSPTGWPGYDSIIYRICSAPLVQPLPVSKTRYQNLWTGHPVRSCMRASNNPLDDAPNPAVFGRSLAFRIARRMGFVALPTVL